MISWRVTKYNPLNRDESGNYLDEKEWTSYSEVGAKVSEEDYLITESNYVNAIISFMEELGINRVHLSDLELWSEEVRNQNTSSFLTKVWVGKGVSTHEIRELAKLSLRNAIWCKLNYKKDFFVHFGYDYYMYIGAYKDCPRAHKKVQETGLFVEKIKSPYLD
ncbi:hypothetical protein AABM38_18665 [Heyndrickxia sp. MSNUG]|uniref:hypothetical protein n=1 Tax=Heyndrickxia sp. MSNUG TaxID=3136677 RepID=UPI003C2FDDE4